MKSAFVHLNVHTNYSLLSGACRIEDLLRRAAELGLDALAITDTNGLYGAVPFLTKAREFGIKPILGAQIECAEGSALCIASDREGYANLCRVITARHLDETFSLADALARYQEGLFILTHDAPLLRWLAGRIQGDRLFHEIQYFVDPDTEGLVQQFRNPVRVSELLDDAGGLEGRERPSNGGAARREGAHPGTRKDATNRSVLERQRGEAPVEVRLFTNPSRVCEKPHLAGVPPVATNNVHFITPAGREIHRVLTAIRKNKLLSEVGADEVAPPDAWLKGADEMARLFSASAVGREAIANTRRIADACNLEAAGCLLQGKPIFPKFFSSLTRISHRVRRQCSENPADIRSPADEPSTRADSTIRPARRFWPEARTHKRVAGSVSVDTLRKTSAEDAASGQKRPPDGERGEKCGLTPEALDGLKDIPPEPAGETPRPEVCVSFTSGACAALRKLAFRGMRERYRPPSPQVLKRLEYELDVIERLHFSEYFLIVWDIASFARRKNIPIVGRGSAGNSLVAYCLGITSVDPLAHDLYFERFLNLSRRDCPDIDLDLCWRRRDEVVNYVYQRHGAERVAMVSNHNTYQARSAFRDVARVFGLPIEQINRLSSVLPHYSSETIRAAKELFPEARDFPLDREPFRTIVALAEALDGFPRHLGIHNGGIVIGDRPLTHYLPLERAAKGIVVTQYEMNAVEAVGLVKIDLLGHRSLTVISDTIAAVKRNRGIGIELAMIPDGDPQTAALLRAGRTIGCFQIESPGMRSLLQMIRAENRLDVIHALSLIRPGPSGSGMKERFVRRRLREESPEYLDPRLEKVLRDTYGVMLFQEDILKVAAVIAGFTLEEGDALRQAISKKRSPERIAALRERFMRGAAEHAPEAARSPASGRGVPRNAAEQIWKCIENFAGYSYCKAHAVTYGYISYQAAYLKAHYPAEFLCAVMANQGGFYETREYLEEARRRGVRILPPDVNLSDAEHHVECVPLCLPQDGTGEPGASRLPGIRIGLAQVKGLSQRALNSILHARTKRQFVSLEDFYFQTQVNDSETEKLILCGALGSLACISHKVWRRSVRVPDSPLRAVMTQAGVAPPITPCAGRDNVFEPARRFWPEPRTHNRATGSVSVDTLRIARAEDEGSGQKRPLDDEPCEKCGLKKTRPQLLWELRLLSAECGTPNAERRLPIAESGILHPAFRNSPSDLSAVVLPPSRDGTKAEALSGVEGAKDESTIRSLQSAIYNPQSALPIPSLPEYPLEERIRLEQETLDLSVSDHPLRMFSKELAERDLATSDQLARKVGRSVTVAGWLVTLRRAVTKNREYMQFLTLEDRFGTMEVILFPRTYRRFGHLIRSYGPYLVRGRVEQNHRSIGITAEWLDTVK